MNYVDKGWMLRFIKRHGENSPQVANMIGRALVALYKRQTWDEKAVLDARHQNEVGFSKPDAPEGSLHAEYFITNRTLKFSMMEKWLQPWGPRRYPRIAKYSRQLNDIAVEKCGPKHDHELEALLKRV